MNKDINEIEEILKEYGETIPVPVELLINPKYNKGDTNGNNRLRHNTAILYGFLSMLPKDKDENGKEYLIITGGIIEKLIGTTNSRVSVMMKQLEEFNLIQRKEIKPGQPYKIYVKEIAR